MRDIKYLINETKHSQLPSFIKGFDVGIIPYKVNDFTNSVYSCKLNDVVNGNTSCIYKSKETNIYNKNHNNIIQIGNSYEKFNEKINYNLKNNTKFKIKNRILAAKKNSWENRLKFFNELIYNIISRKNSAILVGRKNLLENIIIYFTQM